MKSDQLNQVSKAEYIWLDGAKPVQQLRSKTRIVPRVESAKLSLQAFPEWGYDGSSTYQAGGHDSDLTLKPVNFVKDPVRGENHYLVLCEVFKPDNTPHETNSRAELRRILDAGGAKSEPWAGFEQEYTFFSGNTPLGWPSNGYPAAQGPFYCSVGSDVAFGRDIVETHMQRCLEAELCFYGVNAEVMPGQWEFQIGYRGLNSEKVDVLTMADHVWLGRYLLNLTAEERGVRVSYDCKPVKGDWNGAGMHTNFSTKETRDPAKGMGAIENAVAALGKVHAEHIAKYGDGLEQRLTGLHETCSIHQFRSGVADRGSSIRIPRSVSAQGYGYFEDRRPGANANPYDVAAMLVKTVCAIR